MGEPSRGTGFAGRMTPAVRTLGLTMAFGNAVVLLLVCVKCGPTDASPAGAPPLGPHPAASRVRHIDSPEWVSAVAGTGVRRIPGHVLPRFEWPVVYMLLGFAAAGLWPGWRGMRAGGPVVAMAFLGVALPMVARLLYYDAPTPPGALPDRTVSAFLWVCLSVFLQSVFWMFAGAGLSLGRDYRGWAATRALAVLGAGGSLALSLLGIERLVRGTSDWNWVGAGTVQRLMLSVLLVLVLMGLAALGHALLRSLSEKYNRVVLYGVQGAVGLIVLMLVVEPPVSNIRGTRTWFEYGFPVMVVLIGIAPVYLGAIGLADIVRQVYARVEETLVAQAPAREEAAPGGAEPAGEPGTQGAVPETLAPPVPAVQRILRAVPVWAWAAGPGLIVVGVLAGVFWPKAPAVAPEPPKPDPPKTLTNAIGMTMVYLPWGAFRMGSAPLEPERNRDETRHDVSLRHGIYMSAHEVTQHQYNRLMGANPSDFRYGTDYPVEMVSWHDAAAFCKKLSAMEGKTYRLPTEAQWEYACRAGTTTPFCFGPTITPDQANHDSRCAYGNGPVGATYRRTTPVGQFPANAWGLYDMHGNVAEWCRDWYSEYADRDEFDPAGPRDGTRRVVRGGSWDDEPAVCRSAHREYAKPNKCSERIGFRVIVRAPSQ